MGRKRPWQEMTIAVLADGSKVKSSSFVTHEEALGWGAEWMQAHGPDNPLRPSVDAAHRDSGDWPEDELAPGLLPARVGAEVQGADAKDVAGEDAQRVNGTVRRLLAGGGRAR